MAQHLERICKEEALKYSQEALHVIAKISEGCVRDAVKYVDQVSILGDISEEHITKFLGVAPESMIANFLEMMRAGDEKTIFTQVDTIHEQGVDLYNFAKQTLMYIDQHFIEDIPFFAKTSEAFTEIISGIRYYPYPTIVYKIALHKHMG
jgi:DNA polymerase III gamma/tau subunit